MKIFLTWAWWHTPIIPRIKKLRQEDLSSTNLGYVVKNEARYMSNSRNDQEAEVKGLRSRLLGLQNSTLSQKKKKNPPKPKKPSGQF
jgi:hypothetical protein